VIPDHVARADNLTRKRSETVVAFLVGLACAAIVLLGDQAGARLWVWDYLRWVSWPVRFGLALAIVVVSLPAPQTWLARAWRRRPAWLPAWPLIPLSGILFWLLREKTYRGDGLLKLQLLSTKTLQTDPYVWKEPLDALVGYTLTNWLRPLGLGPDVAIAVLSVAAGMIYVAAILEGSRHLGLGPTRRTLLVVGLMALGTSQLWFGHVENYSLVTAFSMVATALALGYLAGKRPLWGAGLAAGAAVAAHPQAIFTLPALLVLLASPGDRRRWPRRALTLGVSGAVVPILTVLALLAAGVRWPGFATAWAGDGQIFWTPRQALMPSHLIDALNNLWLVAPALPLILVAGIGALFRPGPRRDRRFWYTLVLAAGLLVYNFSFQNELPRPRDWDLFAIVGPGVTLWGLYAWLHRHDESPNQPGPPRKPAAWGVPILAFAIAATITWVWVNHSHVILTPNPGEREQFVRYRTADLFDLLSGAAISPDTPFCPDPAADPIGCRRVAPTTFVMPQNGDARAAIFAHAPARISFPLDVPRTPSFLWTSPALDPLAWGWGGDGVTFRVRVAQDGKDTVLWERHLTPGNPADQYWVEAFVPLDAYAGQRVNLVLETDPGPAGNADADRAGWGMPWLMSGTLGVPDGGH
jgi:hypothetical protein